MNTLPNHSHNIRGASIDTFDHSDTGVAVVAAAAAAALTER